MIFSVDIDGTITEEEKGHSYETYLNRTPILSMVKKLRQLHEYGHTIILHSARYLEDEQVTMEWLSMHNVPCDQLVLGKVSADFYIDARNLTPKELLENF